LTSRRKSPDLLDDDGWRWRVLRTSNSYAFTDPYRRRQNLARAGVAPLAVPTKDDVSLERRVFSSSVSHTALVDLGGVCD
jgi:hypothetical protein